MQIQIAISHNYGAFSTPKGFHSDRKGTEWRMDLAQYLMDNANISNIANQYDEELGGIQQITNENGIPYEGQYWFKETTDDSQKLTPSTVETLMVATVETEEPWFIECYEGCESIGTIPSYTKIDKYGCHKYNHE